MKPAPLTLLAVALLAVVGSGAFWLGRHGASESGVSVPAMAASSAERRVLYWHDPMVPGQRFDKPGKSPFMDMELVPVYADEAGPDSGVAIAPQVQQNLGVRTVAATRAALASRIDAVGTVQFDERRMVAVQTRVAGYVEQLAVRAPLERVAAGQRLATIYAPDWLAPLNEIAALKRVGASAELVAAAQARARALSIPAELISRAEGGGTVDARFELRAPAGGVVAELGVREGMAVSPGMSLFRIAGLERVWAVAELPEAQAPLLTRGQALTAELQADPRQRFEGRLQELLPQVNPATRTLQARFELDNRGGRLVPGMLLRLQIAGAASPRLVVPAEAVIRTGTRALVMVQREDGRFESRELQLGAELGEQIEVLGGLREGERVVASGQFLIDSEARLRSVVDAMAPAASAAASAPVDHRQHAGAPR